MCDGGDSGGGFDMNGGNDHSYGASHNNIYHSNNNYYNNENRNSKSTFEKHRLFTFIFLACILMIGFGLGGYLVSSTVSDINSLVSTTGVVIGTKSCGCTSSSTNTSCTTTYSAIIQYVVNGISYEFTTSGCSYPAPSIGSTRKVYYDPVNPSESRDGSFFSLWIGPIVSFGFGVVATFALGFMIHRIRKNRKEELVNSNPFKPNALPPSVPISHISSGTSSSPESFIPDDTALSSTATSGTDYNTSVPYAFNDTKDDDGKKKPSLFDQLQSNTNY